MDLKITLLRREFRKLQRVEPRVGRRLLVLIEVAKGRSLTQVMLDSGASERTIRRWRRRYERGGVVALRRGHGGGRRARPIRGITAQRIREYRLRYGWGAETIAVHLAGEYGTVIGRSRIERFLKRAGLPRKRQRASGTRHAKVVVVHEPGAHTQVDVKYVEREVMGGTRAFTYSFVDHASKWRYRRAYDSFGPSETKDFMTRVLAAVPFVILRLQTDNGIEFTYRYVTNADAPREHALDRLCREQGIRHVLIPPGEKELQGLVERSHRADDDELYHRIRPRDLAALNRELDRHNEWGNRVRRRKPLGWITAEEWLSRYTAINTPSEGDDNVVTPVPRAA
jgi:transposase